MAATLPKRLIREESQEDSTKNPKRHKPYNNILNLLDDDDEQEADPSQEMSAIFTTLQQELSTTTFDFESLPPVADQDTNEDEAVKSVMRHLLEASDDELGIPNTRDANNIEIFNSAENYPLSFSDHVLWELEDEAANYYTVLQSQLFM